MKMVRWLKVPIALVIYLGFQGGGILRAQPSAITPGDTWESRIGSLADQLAAGLVSPGHPAIAVAEFTDLDGKSSRLGRFMAEELTTRLFQTGRFRIVERPLLEQVFQEQHLATTGYIDPVTAAKLGRILGAEAIITGTVAAMKSEVKVNARAIGSASASVLSVASAQLPVDARLRALLVPPQVTAEGDSAKFDGVWDMILACAPVGKARGYTWTVEARIQEGVFTAQYGKEGVPPCISFRGRVEPDGSALIFASGLSGDSRYNLYTRPEGTKVAFHIKASFTRTKGSGQRMENRPCEATFLKHPD